MRGETHHFMALIEYLFHLTFLKTFVRDKNLQCAQRIRASQWKPLIHLLLLLSIVTIFGEFTVTYRMTLKQLRGMCHVLQYRVPPRRRSIIAERKHYDTRMASPNTKPMFLIPSKISVNFARYRSFARRPSSLNIWFWDIIFEGWFCFVL